MHHPNPFRTAERSLGNSRHILLRAARAMRAHRDTACLLKLFVPTSAQNSLPASFIPGKDMMKSRSTLFHSSVPSKKSTTTDSPPVRGVWSGITHSTFFHPAILSVSTLNNVTAGISLKKILRVVGIWAAAEKWMKRSLRSSSVRN